MQGHLHVAFKLNVHHLVVVDIFLRRRAWIANLTVLELGRGNFTTNLFECVTQVFASEGTSRLEKLFHFRKIILAFFTRRVIVEMIVHDFADGNGKAWLAICIVKADFKAVQTATCR